MKRMQSMGPNQKTERLLIDLEREQMGVLFDHIQVGVALIDAETHQIVDLNAKAESMIGCGRANILGNECHEFICPAKHGQCPITDLGQIVDNAEKVLITWEGRRIPILKTVKRIEINGRDYILDSFVDLTDYKATQEALHNSEERFKALFVSARDGIVNIDSNGNIVLWNPAAETIFGYSKEEVGDKNFFDIIAPLRSHDGHKKDLRGLVENGNGTAVGKTLELKGLHKDGREVPVELSLSSVRIGDVWHAIGIVRDIHERKVAEATLKETIAELTLINENIPMAIMMIDSERRIKKANAGAGAFTNRGPGDIIGLMGGDALGCLNRLDDPRGCGFGPECSECPVRNSVIETFRTGIGVHNAEHCLPVLKGGTRGRIYFQFSTALLESSNTRTVLLCIQDVTEQHLKDLAVKESELRFKSIFEGSSDGIMLADPISRRFIMANPAMTRLLGYSNAELLEMSVADIHPAEELPMVTEVFRRQVAGEIEIAEELPVLRKDGRILYCDINSTLHKIDGRDLLMGVFRDVTDKRSMLDAIKREKERAESYLNLAGVMFMAMDCDGKITMANPKAHELLDTEGVGIIGLNWFDNFIPAENRYDVLEFFNRIKAGHVPSIENHENPVITRKGMRRMISWHNSALKDERGNVIGVLSSGEDITEQIAYRDAIRRSEERFKLLSNLTFEGILLHERGTARDVNESFLRMFGYSREEIIGKNVIQLLVLPEHHATIQENIVKNYANPYEVMARKKDGTVFPLELEAKNIQLEGKEVRVVAARDISERKRVAEAIRVSEAKYKLLSENSTDVIWSIDLDGKFQYVSPSVKQLRGFTSEEVLAQSIEEALMPEGIKLFETEMARILDSIAAGSPYEMSRVFELEQPCKGGGTVWTEVSASMVLDETGQVIGIQGVSRNISERKKMQDAMKANIDELERYKRATIEREFRMIELKEELKKLKSGVCCTGTA